MALPSLRESVAAFEPLTPALGRVAIESVAVLALAGLAALMMRRASAAARHAVWLSGFVAILLLPILSAALPGWHVLPFGARASNARSSAIDVVVDLPASTSLDASAQPTAAERRGHAAPIAVVNSNAASASAAPAPHTLAPSSPPRPADPKSASPPWTAWLLPCWALGTFLVLGRVLLGHASLGWLRRRRCTVVDRGELFDLLERLRAEVRLRRPVELLSSAARVMPMTWGLWRARLLVPEQASAWPAAQRRDVLLHELGHVKRWDCLTQLVSQLACAAYWFNPLAWVASRRMQVERERACDNLVLSGGAAPSAYARHLLASVTSVPPLRLTGAAALAMARPSTLEERVRAILDARLSRRGVTARGALATFVLLLPALVPLAILRARQAPAQDAPPPAGGATAAQPGSGAGRDPRGGSADFPGATRPTTNPAVGRPGAPRFGGGRGFGGGPEAAAAPTLGDGPTCTLDATIYDLRLPADQIGRLDVDALVKASGSADAFEKALAALGTAKPMYRANQSVRLSGDTITIGSQVPVVTNSRMTGTGQTINTIQYQSTGALFSIAGKAGAPGGIDLDLKIEVASASDGASGGGGAANGGGGDGGGAVPLANNFKAPVMRRATLSRKGPFQPRQPFVVVSVDGTAVDKDGKAVAYIGRVILGEPQAPAPK